MREDLSVDFHEKKGFEMLAEVIYIDSNHKCFGSDIRSFFVFVVWT